ncbi:MAG: hypothetical protein IKS54_02685 [Erysipelotrichaceae bacterium]|nr:hypothetical protein [Erysipelotrichaceae bacterium]
MSKRSELLKKILMIAVAFFMVVALLPNSAGHTIFAEEDEEEKTAGERAYEEVEALASNPPSTWDNEYDPYGYKVGEDFMLMSQDELFVLKTDGGSASNYSYDTLKAQNTGYPLSETGSKQGYSMASKYTLSFPQAVAFDPTGSNRKDHIAVIGVYTSEKGTEKNPPHVYMYVMDKKNHFSERIDLGKATWMCNDNTLNDDNMWDFNAMNFIGITAGDFNGDGKDSLVVWCCASDPFIHQVDVRSDGTNISLNVLDGNGYTSVTHPSYIDTNDRYVDNRLHGAIEAGDVNGDGIDDLVVLSYTGHTSSNYRKWQTRAYMPYLTVCYGKEDMNTSIVKGEGGKRSTYVQKNNKANESESEWHKAPMAAGLAVGDVDGNGQNDIVIAGFLHEVKGYMYAEAEDAFYDLDSSKLVLAIYDGGLGNRLFDTDQETNGWTRGGSSGGLWISTEPDHSFQQTCVKTVALDGKGHAKNIFINGDLYSFNGSKAAKVYAPTFFQEADLETGDARNGETYVRSAAVGIFDGNEAGHEQIVVVLGAGPKGNPGNAHYMMAMIGGKYEGGDETASGYYCTDKDVITTVANYYPPKNASADCEVDDCFTLNVIAWDNDSDGLHAKYVGKEFVYSDPVVMAILQAPPYYKELENYVDGHETDYSITTSYNIDRTKSDSVSFGIGAGLEAEAGVVKIDVSAGYALDWSKSTTNSYSQGKEYTFEAKGDDQVVIYRTPVTIYNYQIEKDNEWKEKNQFSVSFPDFPAYATMSIPDYNDFVDYYNAEYKKRAQEANEIRKDLEGVDLIDIDNLPLMKKISDKWLGNAGDPLSYMKNTDSQVGKKVLQTTPNTFGIGSSGTAFSWSEEHSTTEEESMAHGFTFDFSIRFGGAGVFGGPYVSLQYMTENSVATTEGEGVGASCDISNILPEALEEDGISRKVASQYGFQYQMVTWPSNLTSNEKRMDTSEGCVPIYGYMLNSPKSAPPVVKNLTAEPELDENDQMVIRLNWEKPEEKNNSFAFYTLYLIQEDGSRTEIATVDEFTDEYIYTNIDGRDSYEFVICTRRSEYGSALSLDSNPAYVYINGSAIYSITLYSSDEKSDTYLVKHTDGSETKIVVKHGVGIVDIKKNDNPDGGLIDTYTIYFSDGSTVTYEVRNGEDGREIELRTYETEDGKQIIQWRYEGEEKWNDLVAVSDSALIEGRKVLLQIKDGYIQWQHEGDGDVWTNLISLEELKGEQGEQGIQGDPGREIELRVDKQTDPETGEETGSGMIQWKYVDEDDDAWRDLIASSDSNLIKGEPGREVVIQLDKESGEIQWKYADEEEWRTLVELSELKGEDGKDGKNIELMYDEASNSILWHYEDEDGWHELVMLESGVLNGEDGREIELNVDENLGFIQWRYVGEGDWTNLISIDELKPAPAKQIELDYDPNTRSVKWRYEGDEKWSDLFVIPNPSNGRDGRDGRGIVSVERTARNGYVDTYTITYTDGTTSSFTVTNGTDTRSSTIISGPDQESKNNSSNNNSTNQNSNSTTNNYYSQNSTEYNETLSHPGISDITVNDNGDLIITLTDGSNVVVGNKEESKADNQSLGDSGLLRTYFFNMPINEFESVSVDGKAVGKDQYTVTSLGDGILLTIRDDSIPKSAKKMDIKGNSNVISTALASTSQGGLPSWFPMAFGAWNTLLTIGLGVIASQFLRLKNNIQ